MRESGQLSMPPVSSLKLCINQWAHCSVPVVAHEKTVPRLNGWPGGGRGAYINRMTRKYTPAGSKVFTCLSSLGMSGGSASPVIGSASWSIDRRAEIRKVVIRMPLFFSINVIHLVEGFLCWEGHLLHLLYLNLEKASQYPMKSNVKTPRWKYGVHNLHLKNMGYEKIWNLTRLRLAEFQIFP